MLRQVVAALAHRLDRPGIDPPRGSRAAAVSFHVAGAVHAGERLRHLAAVAVLDANEEDASGHGDASMATAQQHGLSWTRRQVATESTAPRTGAARYTQR